MGGFDLIVVADEEDEGAALVFVEGLVDGRPYRLLLDTGAATTCLANDDYTSKFPSLGSKRSSGVFATASRGEIIAIPRIKLGPIVKSSFPVTRITPDSGNIRRLAGMDRLKDAVCHFLFDERRVVVDPPAEPECDSMETLVLDQTNHPYVPMRFGDVMADAIWDTGAGITVADLGFVGRHPTFFREIGRSNGTDSSGTTMETPMFEMSRGAIGGAMFPPHTVADVDLSGVNATIDRPMDLILGYSTLSRANWWFDFPRRRWTVTRLLDSA